MSHICHGSANTKSSPFLKIRLPFRCMTRNTCDTRTPRELWPQNALSLISHVGKLGLKEYTLLVFDRKST